MKQKESLRTLQLCILDICLEFKRICEKHNINYFLVGGSLLGAVRHGGFIPWDDDMDVGMLRKDYEQFLKIAKSELKSEFFLQTHETDLGYAHPFAKIRLNHTFLVEDYAEHSKQHNGIYLDIFPYDNMTESKWKQLFSYIKFKMYKWAALGKADYQFQTKKKANFANAMKCIFFSFSQKQLVNGCIDICKKYNHINCNHVINMCGAYQYKEIAAKKDCMDTIDIEFEGYSFLVPNHYKELLTQIYGDYMKLPPEEKRGQQHAMIHIDIGNYRIKNNAKR